MNEGKSCDRLAADIRLPNEYAELPYMGEHYGCVEWTVRAIYTAYLGWFDGNPTHLHSLAPEKRAEKEIALMGGAQAVLKVVQTAVQTADTEEDYQWCLELCDMLIACGGEAGEAAKRVKGEAMLKLAEYETSANGRHYYLCCAKELLGEA